MDDLKFMTKETTTIDKIHELAKQPAKVSIDEVSHAFLTSARV